MLILYFITVLQFLNYSFVNADDLNQSVVRGSQKNGSSIVDIPKPSASLPVANLEGRIGDGALAKSIIERLQSIDADIGKLLYNSTSMYAPEDAAYHDGTKGGEKFTEILNDLDALQDEVSSMINAATRSRQYNMIVRLRPLNNILYRIRNNLYLMRNSLVAINTVSSLEKISNNVIDSTLQVFMRPETNVTDEIGDSGRYDIDLDKAEFTPDFRPISEFRRKQTSPGTTTTTTTTTSKPIESTTTSSPSSSSSPSTTTTTTTTTVAKLTSQGSRLISPQSSTRKPIVSESNSSSSAPLASSSSRRPTRRPGSRRVTRRTSPKPSSISDNAGAATE